MRVSKTETNRENETHVSKGTQKDLMTATPKKQQKHSTIIVTTLDKPVWELIHNDTWIKQNLLRGICLGKKEYGRLFVQKITNPDREVKPTTKDPANMCTTCKRGMCYRCWIVMQEETCGRPRRGRCVGSTGNNK